MRIARFLCLLAVPGLVGSFAACGDDTSATGGNGGGGSGPGDAKHLVVLFTSDEHSHLLAFSPEIDDFPQATEPGEGALVGGVARRSAVLTTLRDEATGAGKDTILVSAGDNQMGCLPHLAFETQSIDYQAMSALKYTVTTFGNHEFDFGPQALANSLNVANDGGYLPPLVASNIHFSEGDPEDDDLEALYGEGAPVTPYRVITTDGGLKVGVIGYVGINAAHVAPNKVPVTFSVPAGTEDDGNVAEHIHLLFEDLQPLVDTLRNDEKVDIVIALAHGGVNDTSSEEGIAAGEDTQVCENVAGIDFIVSGHAHNHDPQPMERVNTATGKPCLVLNAGSFGEEIGTVDFSVGSGVSGVEWDPETQALVAVDDTTAPDPDFALASTDIIDSVEADATLATFLEHAEGAAVDHAETGDLYFHVLANTDFDVTDTHTLNWLSADAMLAQADLLVADGLPATQIALESAGVIRSTLLAGQTGRISAADAFNVVPLGPSPVDGTIGYPLIRGNVSGFELRAVVEFALAQGPVSSDYDLGFAGLKVEFDATRPPVLGLADLFDDTKGQLMKMSLDTDHANGFEDFDLVIYDREAAIGDEQALYSFITSSYIGQFAGDAGVSIKDDAGRAIDLASAIVLRSDDSEVKQLEAFMGFLFASPGGQLPALYDIDSASFTERWVCTAGC